MSEEKNDTGTNNSINPNDLFNNPDNNQPVTESTVEVKEEPVTLTPEPAEIEAEPVVANTTNETSAEVNPIQTDLNQVPPTPQVDTSNQTNGVTQTVTQTVNPTETSPFPSQDMTNTGFTEKIDKKKGIKKPLIIVGCLVVLAILGYFVIYPIIAEKFMASPKNVFEATINKLSTNVNNTLDQVNIGASLYEIEAKFDTNIEAFKAQWAAAYEHRSGEWIRLWILVNSEVDDNGRPVLKKDDEGNPIVASNGQYVYEPNKLIYSFCHPKGNPNSEEYQI